MGLPATPRNIYGGENSGKNLSKTVYEKNCEMLTVNTIFGGNARQISEDSIDSVSIEQGQLVELLSVLSNDVTKPPQISTCDKSTNIQLLTYNDNDMKNIEKRLRSIESELKKSEERTKDWGNRINGAERELVDLHEQMYTIFSKFEEEKKTNYIIVSKVSKDKIIPEDRDILDNLAEESDESDQVDEKEDGHSNSNMDNKVGLTSNPGLAYISKESSDQESDDDGQSAKTYSEDNQKSIEDTTEVILSELKQRSIALETLLESKSRSQISSYLPKKKIPQLSVPPHVIPPYRRSSFAGTDSKAELRKRKLNIRIGNTPNDFYWRAKL